MENLKRTKKDLSLYVCFRGSPSQNMKATLQLYLHVPLHPSLPIPIPFFSSVDHGRLISICFTVISHNSSVAAAVPAYWARLPQRQLSLSASRHRLAALALEHTPRFSGGFPSTASKRSALPLQQCVPAVVLLVASVSFSGAFCWFLRSFKVHL